MCPSRGHASGWRVQGGGDAGPLTPNPLHSLLPPADLYAQCLPLQTLPLPSCPWLPLLAKSLLGPDLLAEAAEDGEEPQDHVGQGQGIGNILPGKVTHLGAARIFGQEETGTLTWSPGERAERLPRSKGPQRGSQGSGSSCFPRPHPRTAPSHHCFAGWSEGGGKQTEEAQEGREGLKMSARERSTAKRVNRHNHGSPLSAPLPPAQAASRPSADPPGTPRSLLSQRPLS